ncbi:MAG: hypothetical protein D6693_09745 [Planctomycetota bacterium]|nr:MAG: hypothetical protein D6693_09745 [Planctomycetota bacterium]
MLAAALAGLAAAGESASRSTDRLARASRPLEAAASLALGCGLSTTSASVSLTPVGAPSAGLTRSVDATDAGGDAVGARVSPRRGESDLPPPARA